jgi:glycosyltransferase involved in cell wall biosynthesis
MSLPKTAYILLWFPKASETFIFREVVNLSRMGLPLKVFTLYDRLADTFSPEMAAFTDVETVGIKGIPDMWDALRYWRRRNPSATADLFRTIPVRRWRNPEVGGENIWAFFAGFLFARRFEAEGIELIHAPWANGPAAAAWVASRLTGIPFSFTGRAVDIYPPDGALEDKIRESVFVRTNTAANVKYLTQFAGGREDKIHLIYNGYPIRNFREAPVEMKPPFKLAALGRFARFKGYEVLLRAARILKDRGFDFHLTLGGSGLRGYKFRLAARALGLQDHVSFPGYITHDKVSDFYCNADMFLMPSVIHGTGERDGIPNVIVEALLHRLPVIATNVSGIGEVIRHEETGLVVKPGDDRDLAEAVIRMASDRTAALKLAENGRDRVLAQFDPETNHRKIIELYEAHHSPEQRPQ